MNKDDRELYIEQEYIARIENLFHAGLRWQMDKYFLDVLANKLWRAYDEYENYTEQR